MPKITKQLIDAMQAPARGEVCVWDTELPGFGVRVQAGGRKVYLVRYRARGEDGKPVQRKMTLCATTVAPPNKARDMAREVFQKVAAGEDPCGERKPKKADEALTIGNLFRARVAAMRAKNRAMADEVERVLLLSGNNAANFLGHDRTPADVKPSDIVKYLKTYYADGHRGAANKARSYLAATFAWGIRSANDYTVDKSQDWGLTINPAGAVAKDEGAETARDRALDRAELAAFWVACNDGNAGFTETTEAALLTIMACGQRVQETLRLEGADLDLQKKLWIMPAHKTKGQKVKHVIPLPDIIVPYLERQKAKHGDGPLFPSTNASSESGVMSPLGLAHAVRRYCMRKDVVPFQTRDLRRTWKSRAHDAGVSLQTRDLLQQHAKVGTSGKHYDHADYFPQMRAGMDAWSAWLTAAVEEPKQQAEPLPLAA